MKGVTVLLLSALFAAGPALAETSIDQKMADVLRAYAEVWNTGEVDRLDGLVTDDFVRHGGFAPARSRAGLADVIRGSRNFYRDLRIEVFDAVANPQKGAMRWRFTGGWGATRFEVDSLNFAMYHFVDGKISQEWVLGNNMDLFRTFGYRLVPPQHEIVPPPIAEAPGPTLEERMTSSAADLRRHAEATRERTEKKTAELEVTSAVGCRLMVDDEDLGWLPSGDSVTLRLDRGKHTVAAASAGGSVFFEETVSVRNARPATIEIAAPGRVIVQPSRRTTEDLTTGLMWQMKDNGQDATKTAAVAHCRDLEQGGFDDWRLPTIHELQSLHDPSTAGNKRYRSIDGVSLSDCCPWSSTPHGDYTWTYAFSMDMRYLQYEALGYHMRVLCVRDTTAPSPRDSKEDV